MEMTNSNTPEENTANYEGYNLLFKDYHKLTKKSTHISKFSIGTPPMKRPLDQYLNKGFIALDKPSNPSSHEVSSWIKKILKIKKSGHAGTLDPKVTGCLLVLLGKSTKLSSILSGQSKKYVCAMKVNFPPSFSPNSLFNISTPKENKIKILKEALQYFIGKLYQKPPIQSAVKRRLRFRTIYSNTFLEYNNNNDILLFETECEAGTYIRTLCFHIGLYIGVPCYMKELRRIKSGWFKEGGSYSNLKMYSSEEDEYFNRTFTLYDVLDAYKAIENGVKFDLNKLNYYFLNRNIKPEIDFGVENYIRTVVRPIEALLMKYKRIFVGDGCLSALSSGAKLAIPGIVKFDKSIEKGDIVVVVSMQGEAFCVGEALMSGDEINDNDYGFAVKSKIVLVDSKDYVKDWGNGPHSKKNDK